MAAALSALRDATADAQRALEAAPATLRLMSPAVTLDDYRAWLQVQLAVLAPWCQGYPHAMRRAVRFDPCSRLEALHLDLAELHGELPDDDPAFDWPPDSPAWWGGLYVLENARLAERGIARHLRRQLGVCVAGALRYLDPANEASLPAWPSLVQALERALPPPRRAAAIEGAQQTLARYAELHRRAAARLEDAGRDIVAA